MSSQGPYPRSLGYIVETQATPWPEAHGLNTLYTSIFGGENKETKRTVTETLITKPTDAFSPLLLLHLSLKYCV